MLDDAGLLNSPSAEDSTPSRAARICLASLQVDDTAEINLVCRLPYLCRNVREMHCSQQGANLRVGRCVVITSCFDSRRVPVLMCASASHLAMVCSASCACLGGMDLAGGGRGGRRDLECKAFK